MHLVDSSVFALQMSILRNKKVNIAPDVIVPEPDYHVLPSSAKEISYNPPVERLYAPIAGPANPFRPTPAGAHNIVSGNFERSHLSEYMFQQQYRANNREGCPEDARRDWETKSRKADREKDKRRRSAAGEEVEDEDDSDEEERQRRKESLGDVDPKRMKLVARKEGNALSLEGDEDREGLTVYFEEDEKRGVRIARYEAIEPKSLLHRKEIYDYQVPARFPLF